VHECGGQTIGLIGQEMTTRTKGLLALIVVATIAIGALVMWRGAAERVPTVERDPLRGGVLTASLRTEPRTFNRYAGRDAASDLIAHLMHARLVRINQVTHASEPWLAESVDSTPDGLTHTLKLRTDVLFSDGVPFTSADVLFAFDAAYDAATGSPVGESLKIGGRPISASAPDAATVVLKFPSSYGPGLRILDNLPILPRHRLEPALKAGTLATAWGVTTPPSELVGLGPFVLDQYEPGQRLVFSRNPHYWRKDASGERLPLLDRLVLELIPDQNTEVLRLQAGTLDLIQSEVRPEDYRQLRRSESEGRLRLFDLGVGLDPSFLWFNLNPDAKQNDPRRAWLQSTELRRAISLAVDRQTFADTVFLGAGVPVFGPVTPGNPDWVSAAVLPHRADPQRARTILVGLGLQDRNADGLLDGPSGQTARFSLLTQKGNTARERGAVVIQEDLRRIGLQVDVVTLDPGSLVDRLMRGDYDAMYYGTLASDTDPAVNLDFWLSSGPFHAWHPQQRVPATDWERRIDELMQRQVAALDPAERKRLFDQVQQIFAEQLPALYFVAPRMYIAMSARVLNATPALLRPHVLWNSDTLAVRSPQASRRES
jgi:peptide/nickel transport system substrate-binding protein